MTPDQLMTTEAPVTVEGQVIADDLDECLMNAMDLVTVADLAIAESS